MNKQSKNSIFISYYKPHSRLFFIDMFCALLMVGIDLAFPMLSRLVLNDYLPTKAEHLKPFILFMVLFVGLYITRSFFTIRCGLLGAYTGCAYGI